MDVEGLFGMGPQRLHHLGSDGDVGHEMTVHDIDMDPVGARRLDSLYFRAQLGKIGGENRRRDQNRLGHEFKCRIRARAAMPGAPWMEVQKARNGLLKPM